MTATKKFSASTAAATFAALLAATMTIPTTTNIESSRSAPTLQAQQSVQSERSSAPTSAPTPIQSVGVSDDPKKNRVIAQRRNAIRQVRRRMERAGYCLTGRQWRNLQKTARKFLATGVVS